MTADSQIIEGLVIEEYHAMPGISKSGLDSIEKSPAIFYARHLDPKRPPRKMKAGQLHGSLAHCAILEPEEFDKRYVIGPDWNRNTNKWKEWLAELPVGMVAIKQEDYDIAHWQADSVSRLPEVAQAIEVGTPEVSALWTDSETGASCRVRPDWVHDVSEDSVILLDVKTYSDASPSEFQRQAARKRYHVQDALYSDGFAIASKRDVLAFIFVAVETEWPYAANAMMFDEVSRNSGRAAYRRNLNAYAQCAQANQWPGYSTAIELISLPAWAL